MSENLDYDNVEEQRHWNNEYAWVEHEHYWSDFFGGIDKLWNDIIYPKIGNYLKGDVLEIAPGFGRITTYLKDKVNNLTIVDLNQLCIDKCKEKFGDTIKYYVNDGRHLDMIESNSLDFVFSWDSFVHMDEDVINCYLGEIYRVLKSGGHSIIHHSFLYGGNKKSFRNLGGRSNMTPSRFKELAENNNLEVINQEDIIWTVTDTITTIKKK